MSWFTQPWGALGLLAVPAVVALHLFRRRYQRVPIAALFLWEDAHQTESSGRRRQPLRRTPSFWLEVAAALLAGLLLAGFDPLSNQEARHLVAVLDDSASMSHPATREAAVEALQSQFDAAGRRTRVTLVSSGVRPRLLVGPAALLPDARKALQAWQPSAPHHDVGPALGFARELASGGEILFVSDRAPAADSQPEDVRWLATGVPANNVALGDARRIVLDDGSQEIVLLVRSFSSRTETVRLSLESGGAELTARELQLEANGEQRLRLPLPPGTPELLVRLADDALLLDNRARLLPPVDRSVKIGIAVEEAAAQALRLQALRDALPMVEAASNLADADLVIAHDVAAAPAWSLVLPRDPGSADAAEAYVSGFLAEKSHAAMRELTLHGVVWTRAKQFSLPGLPLLSVADHALMTEQAIADAVVFHLNLLGTRSTLANSPDWPILLTNLVELRRASLPGPRRVNLIAGEAFELRHAGAHQYQLLGANEREIFGEDVLVIEDLPPHDRYELRADDGASWEFAVNFRDVRESDLRLADSGEFPPSRVGLSIQRDAYAESPAARMLLLLLLGCIAADWWVLRRGIAA